MNTPTLIILGIAGIICLLGIKETDNPVACALFVGMAIIGTLALLSLSFGS